MRWVLLALVLAGTADGIINWELHRAPLTHYLTWRLESAVGRRVEVAGYAFKLMSGPSLQAESVVVAEDPRFGNEYFLRAEELTCGLRWRALLRGRIEFSSLSFTRPSLNIVSTGGRWNIGEWLPRSREQGSAGAFVSPRFAHIEVNDGRVNFKYGAGKLPFALVLVNGYIEQESSGRWRVDLAAQPFRAGVLLQQAADLRLGGTVGGVSSRFRPADLDLSWNDASISDLSRLARDYDYGARGLFSGHLTARAEAADWTLTARAELRQVHRWDLPQRPDNPAVNLIVGARWLPGSGRIELRDALLETPRSTVRASGFGRATDSSQRTGARGHDAEFLVHSANLRMDDLLAWYRAFHPGVAAELGFSGVAQGEFRLTGWPPHITSADVTARDLALEGGALRVPVRLSPIHWRLGNAQSDWTAAALTFGDGADIFRIEAPAGRGKRAQGVLRVSGQTLHAEDLFETASALGWPLPRGWKVQGAARLDVHWLGFSRQALLEPAGVIQMDGLLLRTPFLVEQAGPVMGQMEFATGEERVTLESAQLFHATWTGTIARQADASAGWTWELSADHLDVADLNQGLNPRYREGMLARILPFLDSRTPAIVPAGLRGQGRLMVAKFSLGALELEDLRGDLSVEGRHLRLENAQADFYGGSVRGSFQADLQQRASYRADVAFEDVNLAALTEPFPALRSHFGGIAGGKIAISANGAPAGSLQCRGASEVRNAEIRGINLLDSFRDARLRSGTSPFPLAEASFRCDQGTVEFSELRLNGPMGEVRASGSVDYARNLNLRIHHASPLMAARSSKVADGAGGVDFDVTGTLDSPTLHPASSSGRP